MKTALVTGAGGWIGLELVKELLVKGYSVKALVRKKNTKLDELNKKYKGKLKVIFGDMIDLEKWEGEMMNINSLFHLAAKVHSKPKTKEEENEFYLINRDCTKRLFDKALKYDVEKVVFVSTVAVYGNHEENIISSDTERKPITPYAISKNEAEIYGMKLYKEKKLPLTIIQPVTVYGGNDRGNFKKLYNLANKGILIKFGRGLNKKSIIYYKDLVRMMLNISEDINTSGKIFICGTENIEYNNILMKIKSESNANLILYIPDKISSLAVNILKHIPVKKLNNLSQNINTLMCNNLYNYDSVKEYINDEMLFKNWKCKEEYNR